MLGSEAVLKDAAMISMYYMLEKLAENNVSIITDTRVDEIIGSGVLTTDNKFRRRDYPADTVILATGMNARKDKVQELRRLIPETEVFVVGDCSQPRNIAGAVNAGFNAAGDLSRGSHRGVCRLTARRGKRRMQYIDTDTWDRREYFEGYLGADFPYISIGAHIDVTNLTAFASRKRISSYISMVFCAHHTAQSIENFRYRIREGKPVINERMRPSFTHLPEGRDLFINVTMDFVDDILEFHERAQAQIAKQGTDLGLAGFLDSYDVILYSAVPWIQYTHFIRTITSIGVDSNPKISWGKYFQQGERVLVPFSVQVHHGLMDGLHVGRYFEEFLRSIDDLE